MRYILLCFIGAAAPAFAAWQTPVNLGRVVNSPTDEYPRWVSDDADTLVFCSRREGGAFV